MCGGGGLLGSILGLVGASQAAKQSNVTVSPTTVSAAPSAVDVTSGKDAVEAIGTAKKKAALAAGAQSTIKTGSTGVVGQATTGKKSLLGG